MAYKIAVATSDCEHVNLAFGSTGQFCIYRADAYGYELIEKRDVPEDIKEHAAGNNECSGFGGHCAHGEGGSNPWVELLNDCRIILCSKMGSPVQREFEKNAVNVFIIDGSIDTAIKKIIHYYDCVDNHKSLGRR